MGMNAIGFPTPYVQFRYALMRVPDFCTSRACGVGRNLPRRFQRNRVPRVVTTVRGIVHLPRERFCFSPLVLGLPTNKADVGPYIYHPRLYPLSVYQWVLLVRHSQGTECEF